MSRIGKKPVALPQGVKVTLSDNAIIIEGSKGELSLALPERINIEIKDNQIFVKSPIDTKIDRSMYGLIRAKIANMVIGVMQGYRKDLEIIGVGFKAQLQGKSLNMQLRFSHPVNYPIPEGIKIETPKLTQIIITGIDKEKVGEVASEIRAVCPPEPYKGTGIRYLGEYVKKKVGKAQATTK